MAKLFGIMSGISVILLVLACAPRASPAVTPTSRAPQAATPMLVAVTPIRAEDAAWQKIVEAARKESNLTIYSSNFTGDIGLALNKSFKERYGIQLNIITGRGAEFIERLKTEKRMGALVGDLHDGNAANTRLMKEQGLTMGIAGELPVLREKDVWVADILRIDPQDKHLISFNFILYSPYINTNIVKSGEEPKVWRDFLNPKWKSAMVAVNPTTSAGLFNQFVPLMREKVIDEDFLKALYKQDLRFSRTLEDEATLLSRGERSISISGNNISFSRYISEGAPIRPVEFSHGTVLSALLVAFKGAPHPNAAKVFINWLLSREGQAVWGKSNSVASVRKDVPNFLPQAAQVTPRQLILSTAEDVDVVAKLFTDRWLDKLWGR